MSIRAANSRSAARSHSPTSSCGSRQWAGTFPHRFDRLTLFSGRPLSPSRRFAMHRRLLRLLASLSLCGMAALCCHCPRRGCSARGAAAAAEAGRDVQLQRRLLRAPAARSKGTGRSSSRSRRPTSTTCLKSLVVQDRGGGLVTAVNYGSPEPIARTLRTFAIDLTANADAGRDFSAASRPEGAAGSAGRRRRGRSSASRPARCPRRQGRSRSRC